MHDDVLNGPALWSVTILVDNTTFKFEHLHQVRPMVVKFSNLQMWAASRILPKGRCQVKFVYSSLHSVNDDAMREMVPFEALNRLLACLRYVGGDVRPFSILEVADGM